jgi:hypothetical protein
MRDSNRSLNKEVKQLRREKEGQPSAVVVGKEPSMDDPDIDYDAEKFKQKYAGWIERKGQADKAAGEIETQQKQQAESWQNTLNTHAEKKTELNVPDYEDAEGAVTDTLSETQQGILIHGAKNSARLVYALGNNPAKLKELAGITDNVKFAVALGELEGQVKVTKRKPITKPEGKTTGTGQISGTTDATLDALEKAAEKSGNRTEVIAHKRKMKQQA